MERKAFLKIINESLRNVLGEDFDTNDNDEITKIVTSMIPLEDIIENEEIDGYRKIVLSQKWNNPFMIMSLTMALNKLGYTCKASREVNAMLCLYIYNY